VYRQRAAVYHLTRVKVLEVGAGDGRLSHYLKLLLTPPPAEAQTVSGDFLLTQGNPGISSQSLFGRIYLVRLNQVEGLDLEGNSMYSTFEL
jgi:hypothetical protein